MAPRLSAPLLVAVQSRAISGYLVGGSRALSGSLAVTDGGSPERGAGEFRPVGEELAEEVEACEVEAYTSSHLG